MIDYKKMFQDNPNLTVLLIENMGNHADAMYDFLERLFDGDGSFDHEELEMVLYGELQDPIPDEDDGEDEEEVREREDKDTQGGFLGVLKENRKMRSYLEKLYKGDDILDYDKLEVLLFGEMLNKEGGE